METITKNGINCQDKLKIIVDYIGPYYMKWPKKSRINCPNLMIFTTTKNGKKIPKWLNMTQNKKK